MTEVDLTGAGAVSHNGEEVISRANQAIITGGCDDDGHVLVCWVGHGWDGYGL